MRSRHGARIGHGLLSARVWGLIGLTALALSGTGCMRKLAVYQDRFVNTGAQAGRQESERTGSPLDVTIVCVYPADLNKPGNEGLKPGSNITTKDWYEKRPVAAANEPGKFALPADQIFVMTRDSSYWGTKVGEPLRGAALDGEEPKRIEFAYKWGDLHDRQAVIYVFPKFLDRNGSVLAVMPAKFDPPGDYDPNLAVRIGVTPGPDAEKSQYVRVESERKLNRK